MAGPDVDIDDFTFESELFRTSLVPVPPNNLEFEEYAVPFILPLPAALSNAFAASMTDWGFVSIILEPPSDSVVMVRGEVVDGGVADCGAVTLDCDVFGRRGRARFDPADTDRLRKEEEEECTNG